MIFNKLHFPNYRAFQRLLDIELRQRNGLPRSVKLRLVHLASEHGICKDDAVELMDMTE